MKQRKKKKSIFKSTFYRVYFALVLVALVGIAAGTSWLKGLLSDYESAQPVYVAEEVAQLFESADYGDIYALDTSAAQIAEGDREFYIESMNALSEGKAVAWSEAFSPDEDERRYSVTLDGERFASFTLVPSGQSTRKGNRLWTLGSVTTNVVLSKPEPEPEPEEPETLYQCRITAPRGYAVTVDGVELGDGNAQMSEKKLFVEGFLPDVIENPVMIEYLFDATSVTPQISATDENGDAAVVKLSADRALTWTCLLREDETCREKYGEAATALAKQVAKYISQDAEKKSIQRICAKDSPAADIFENLYNRYATPHKKVSFRNESASEFYALSENCFTCRVTFDYILDTQNGEMVYPTDYTFCVIHDDSSGKLYNILIS